jgi:tetratricopeptide (TPR) repeat protein
VVITLLYNAGSLDKSTDVGSIVRICQENGVYIVQTSLGKATNQALLIQNVTRSSCNMAIVTLNVNLLNGLQGQAYFDKLVQSANFRRYIIKQKVLGFDSTIVAISYDKLAEDYYKKSQLNQAEKSFTMALEIRLRVLGTNHPDVANSYNNLGSVYRDLGQLNKAAQYFAKALTGTENLRVQSQDVKPDATLQDGIRAYQRGQYDEAIKLYDQYLSKNYNDAYVLNLKGYSLFKLKRYDEAITALLTATKADPKYAWAYFDLARVYCAMGKSSEANSAINQAISLQPDMQTIMRNDNEFQSLCGRGATAK